MRRGSWNCLGAARLNLVHKQTPRLFPWFNLRNQGFSHLLDALRKRSLLRKGIPRDREEDGGGREGNPGCRCSCPGQIVAGPHEGISRWFAHLGGFGDFAVRGGWANAQGSFVSQVGDRPIKIIGVKNQSW